MSIRKIARFLNINRSVYGVQGEGERWFQLPKEGRREASRRGRFASHGGTGSLFLRVEGGDIDGRMG